MRTKRLEWIDIARCLCIVLVVFGHYVAPTTTPMWYSEAKDCVYSFHMPLFMLLSGFTYAVTNKKNIPYVHFIKKKALRLLLPYFSTSLVVIFIKVMTQQFLYVKNPIGYAEVVEILYYPSVCYCLWFIWVLFIFFLIIPLFKTDLSRVFLFGASIVLYFIPNFLPEVFCLNHVQRMLVYFVLGILLYDYREVLSCFKRIPIQVLIFLSMCIFGISYHTLHLMDLSLLTALAGTAMFCLFSIGISRTNTAFKRQILNVSSSSFVVYLLHTIVIGLGVVFLKHPIISSMKGDFVQVLSIFGITFIAFVVPILVDRLVLNKNKYLAFLFGTSL